MRTDLDPDELGGRSFYKILTSVVLPRPIAWVSTRSAEGVDNLAPHSFFTVSCVDPAMASLRPLARLGREQWSTIGEVRTITRIPYGRWPDHYSPPTA